MGVPWHLVSQLLDIEVENYASTLALEKIFFSVFVQFGCDSIKSIEILKAQNMLLNWDNFQILDCKIRDSIVYISDNLGKFNCLIFFHQD